MDEEQAKQLAAQVARSQAEGGDMHRPRPPKNLTAAQKEENRLKMLDAAGKIAPNAEDAREQAKRKKKKTSASYAKGGKVRGCGIARRGLGVGARGR